MKNNLKVTSEHWSNYAKSKRINRINWLESGYITRCMNYRVCGDHIGGNCKGMHVKLKQALGDRKIEKGVSVGCGRGLKEMALIKHGFVDYFYLFDVSHIFLEQGRLKANELGVSDNVLFSDANAFTYFQDGTLDMVHWDASLHHMVDVKSAVKWSYDVLRPGGIFYMNDYVGPNRFQFSDKVIDACNKIRNVFPDHFFCNPFRENSFIPRNIKKPDPLKISAADPTEAVDSEAIIPAVRQYFCNADIIFTGGAIFPTLLNTIIHNIHEEHDRKYLELAEAIDKLFIDLKISHFAATVAVKEM